MDRPKVDDRDPADAIDQMVEHVLRLASTWTRWKGDAVLADGRRYTPHKAIRRVADHLLDHLAQLDAHLAGTGSIPDRWHGSASTTPADTAPFEENDLDEARSRLTRLAQLWRNRLAQVPVDEFDRSERGDYTPREMAFCAVESGCYADAIGELPALISR